MKKSAVLIGCVGLILLVSGCSKIPEKTERQELGLRGSVERVLEKSYSYSIDEDDVETLLPDRSDWNENSFDFEVTFTPKGDVTERIIFDDQYQPMLVNKYHFENDLIQFVEVFTQGNTTQVPDFISRFTYNEQGKRNTLTMYNADSLMMMYQEYGYDAEGHPYDELIFDENKERIGRNFYKYSKDGKMLESIISGAEGEQLEKREYDYNRHGALIQTKVYDDKNELIEHTKQSVNKLGDVTKLKMFGLNDELKEERTYTYNENCDLELMVVELPLEKKVLHVEYSYEYDDHGNWISCVESTTDDATGDVTCYIVTRDLTYFE